MRGSSGRYLALPIYYYYQILISICTTAQNISHENVKYIAIRLALRKSKGISSESSLYVLHLQPYGHTNHYLIIFYHEGQPTCLPAAVMSKQMVITLICFALVFELWHAISLHLRVQPQRGKFSSASNNAHYSASSASLYIEIFIGYCSSKLNDLIYRHRYQWNYLKLYSCRQFYFQGNNISIGYHR